MDHELSGRGARALGIWACTPWTGTLHTALTLKSHQETDRGLARVNHRATCKVGFACSPQTPSQLKTLSSQMSQLLWPAPGWRLS